MEGRGIRALAFAKAAGGGGSNSGTVVLNIVDGHLDKTFAEIETLVLNGTLCVVVNTERPGEGEVQTTLGIVTRLSSAEGQYYTVEAFDFYFEATSPDDYPAM